MPNTLLKDKVFNLLQIQGVASGRALSAIGLSKSYLYELSGTGEIVKVGRGLFSLPNADLTIIHSLAEVGAYMPNAVICLLSALQFHEIGTQLPPVVWVAFKPHSYIPKHPPTSIQAVYMVPKFLNLGMERHVIEGVPVKITGIAKTIVDCFKRRRDVSLDVSMEALKDVIANNRVHVDEIYQMAEQCHASRIIYPYLEALT